MQYCKSIRVTEGGDEVFVCVWVSEGGVGLGGGSCFILSEYGL